MKPSVGLVRAWLVTTEEDPTAAIPWTSERLPDPDGALRRRYGATSACLYLIRPDGYIGYRAQPSSADKLQVYLDRLFDASNGDRRSDS